MTTTTFHVRMPIALKKKAQKIAETNGLDLATAVRIFFTHMVRRQTIPLPWLTENGLTAKAEKALLQQIKYPDIVASFDSAKEASDYIDAL